ncbi:MAG: type II toxin-antitoxin system PemK/MazF family toxin [Planctomycetes bacterium]|nr:type II toxin-antitoxin system PemK/MazF family toxin [Planctomycetota bacterium]
MVRGEIFFIDLRPRSGSEQRGLRPGLLVSHNSFNTVSGWQSVTVIPMTTSARWMRPSPTTVLFTKGECGLPKACAALAHQITTVDKSKLIGPALGRVTGDKLEGVDEAIRNYLSL